MNISAKITFIFTYLYLLGNCASVAKSQKTWDEKLKLKKLLPAIEILRTLRMEIGIRDFLASALFFLGYKLSFLKYP